MIVYIKMVEHATKYYKLRLLFMRAVYIAKLYDEKYCTAGQLS